MGYISGDMVAGSGDDHKNLCLERRCVRERQYTGVQGEMRMESLGIFVSP